MPEPISPLPTTPIRLKSLPTNAVMGSEAICGHRLGSWARMRLVLTISRRDFLALGASAVAVVPLARSFPGPGARAIEPGNPFAFGVTSGDPDASSAVLWTRLAGDGSR